MDSLTKPKRTSTSSQHSEISASVTAVNSPDKPQFPTCTRLSDAANSGSRTSSSDDDRSEDQDTSSSFADKTAIEGWPQLAQQMSITPDFAAFPRFRELNAKSLLYYQCQLTNLQSELHKQEVRDALAGKDWNEYADDLVVEKNSDQFKLMEQIREVLEKYNNALLQYSQVCALPEPEPFNMRSLRKWLRQKEYADFKVRGRNNLENTWGDVYKDPDGEMGGLWKQFFLLLWGLVWAPTPTNGDLDLAKTSPEIKVDGLTRWVAAELIPFYRALTKRYWKKKKRPEDVEKKGTTPASKASRVKKGETLESWSERGPLRVTSGISTIVACLLPVVAISVLSQLHGLRDLLFCLAGFAIVFALGLIFLTQGTSSRTEIFAATAAFSAVMVVFISQPPPPVVTVVPGSTVPSISPSLTPTLL